MLQQACQSAKKVSTFVQASHTRLIVVRLLYINLCVNSINYKIIPTHGLVQKHGLSASGYIMESGADPGVEEGGSTKISAHKTFGHAPKSIDHTS